MQDLFDDFPDYTLDEVDKKIDVLDNLVSSFSDAIASSKDTLDNLDEEIRAIDDNLNQIDERLQEIDLELYNIDSDMIDLEEEKWRLENNPDNIEESCSYQTPDEIDNDMWILEGEEYEYRQEKEHLLKSQRRMNDDKLKLVQSASNLLRSLNIQLNQLKHYQMS